MDGTTCLKSLLLSINQYKSSRSAANAAQLQKLIHDLCGMKGPRLLSPQQVLPSECLSGLVELAGDPNIDPCLSSIIISLLAQLASDEEIKVALNSTYNLTGTLASVIHSNSATPREGVVLQCLQVLQSLTYSARVSHCFTHMDELLAFLVQHIQAPNDDLTVPCLGLMANLCRYNVSVQTHIKSLSHVKVFYRTLINFLAHSSLTVVVFALSVLTSLTLNEEVGEKLFHARNIHQTFQLIFNIIVNGDGTLTRKYAVDLLVDLVKNPKIANYLTRYEHFSPCLSQVLGLLHNKDPDSAAKVLELLLSLCSVPGLRTLLCQAVFRPAGARLRLGSKKEPQGCGGEPGVALVHWVSMPLDGPDKCYLQALLLLEELFEETIDSALYSSAQPFLDLLLPVLLTMLEAPDSTCSERLLKKHCSRVARALDLLLVLCTEDSMRMLVAQGLSAAVCLAQMEALFSSGQMDVSFGCTVADSELSQVASEVILKMLDLMRHLKQLVLDMETSFYRILQDQRVVAPLSQSLTSDHREHVQTALRILFEAAPLPDFPVVLLGESITANNAYRQREAELSASRLSGLEPLPAPMLSRSCPPPAPSCQSSGPSQDAIHSLIEKLQSSMELQDHVKDLRVSEIMDVYEQKISALASKEGRLQDLLEAKAMALSQADRLIAQYRCQRAQAEAEARKLASLLKEAEHRKEELQVELSGQVLEAERAQADIQQLLQHNARLQADSQDHQALKASYNELLNRFNDSERMLKELQSAHIILTKQAEVLRKQNEGLKVQQDRVLSQLAEKEEQIKHLNRNIEEKVQEISGLQEEVRSQEERVRQMDKEKEDMEETIDVLRKELNKTEQARKEASIRASSLELQKSQLEAKLQKKEEELSKHSQMIAMIHSLSSGKLKSDSLSL
ncbi:protein CIP2A [Scleropages formosus]|uniref:protein CIP2A n=1 Tax=Scleropages formosus TaxID=113540 RepID=UPI0010FAA062|nr:protein CIP2A [Scleropages formosus]